MVVGDGAAHHAGAHAVAAGCVADPESGAGEGCAATVDGGHPSFAAPACNGQGVLAEPDLMASALVVALASSVLPYSLEFEALRRSRRRCSAC
jgi:threonine/homoserine efflux transporter RhtA